ncbi:MAG TPA: amino acid adenylation domain-containing protein, partial [Longimicrobiaceae bacterium]|nr:amino acid adenylation domain-containing protein [Longimicrobiaceae bacterium]
MTITTLLERLGTAGIRLRVHDGELRVVGNRAALDPETVGQLREHKAALLEIVGGHGWGARGGGPCIHELFEAQVERTPDAAALLCGDRSLSYAELNAGANQLAHHLRDLGVGPDSRVGICLEPGPEMMVGVFGVLKAGGAYVPLDPSYPEERLGYMLRDSAPVVLLTRASLEDRFAGTGPSMLDVGAQEPAWTGAPRTNPERGRVGLTPRHLAYVIYTSGSTGRPKGVRVEHGSLVSTLVAAREAFGFGPTDRVHALASFAFDIWLFESLLPLLAGSGVRLVTREEVLDVPRLVAELSGCTAVHAVPALMRRIVQEVRAAPEGTLPAVRRVFVGGDAVAPELLAEMRAVFPAAQVHVLYGPTEGTIICAAHRASPEAAWRQMVGRPLGNAALYVLDAEGSAALVGAPGEICLGGGSVARDYLGRPELTAERFVPDPFGKEPGGRLYRTGDQGRWLPDGSIEFLGRNDAQVKVRGFRIELGEVEARLLEHPGLREAVVVAREDDAGEKRLVAYWAGPDEVRADGLRAYLAERLPEYMVPAAYVRLEVLPLTPNGKLDRRALPAPEGDAYARRGYEAPQGEVEQALAEIWAEVLKVERVGRSDHFFELGGHSLLAVQVASRVRQRLGAEVPLGEVFRVPVLAEYARTVAAAARADLPPIEPAERTAPLPLSFAQQRLWFLEQMGGLGNAYHIPWRLRLRGELDRAALRQALDRIVARHEALRTSFSVAGGEPVQRITPSEESRFPLAEHDLRGAAEPEEELRRLLSQEWSTLFDLERGPLIRGCLVRLGEEEHALQVIMHHVVADGWSMGVFTRELSALYAAFRSGEADPLPELPVQYADYAVWQRRWVEGEVLRQQAEYWKRTLAGAPELLELPADRPRPAQQDFAGAALGVVLDEELTAGLKVLSQRQGTTLFMTLLAGWAVVLSRLSGQEDLVVGTPTANRGRREIEGLIGFFVNTLALRVDLSGAPTVAELLERVRERALEAQQNQDIPFEQVVEAVRPARSLAHTPLFQVTLAWQNAPGGELELPGLTRVGAGGAEQVSAKYDLSLSLGESEGRIVGGAQYAASLFGRGTMERYLGYLRRVLEEMAAGPERPVAGLEMLPEEERQQVVERWNATEAPYPRELCVHQLFEAQARRSPDAVALVFAGEALSYAELNARANRLAHHL